MCTKACKVILNRMSPEYVQNTLLGKIANSEQHTKTVKTIVHNVCQTASSHTKVRT